MINAKFNFYWFLFRMSALLILSGFIIENEVILLIFGFLFLHIRLGLNAITSDYIHSKKLRLIVNSLIRISIVEILGYTLELFF
uniref:Succinate:cytochrome c oxidoreductase subunit 4 n=1 Tax=Schimmelmannia schousboei TaxID=173468 RepID=A0A0E3DB64_9FLOR|nr:succinate:cytochrome c oxidoreductase subunit 4 [Schimmelmannia schousboei]